MDQIFRFYGSGRDPHTRNLRRLAHFKPRAVAVGANISIRPGRRNDVAVGVAAPHAMELQRLMRLGILRVFSASNAEYTPDTFVAACAAVASAPVTAPAVTEPLPAVLEAAVEPTPPEAVVEAETMEVEPPALAVTEPAPPEAPVETMDRASMLPEGWRTKSNAAITDIMSALGIPVPEKITKVNLVSAIEAWIG